MKNIISVIGTHGSGKTTAIKRYSKQSNYRFLTNLEVARSCPYKVGSTSNKMAQDWIIKTQYTLEQKISLSNLPSLLDRSLIDQYAYYIYWVGESNEIENLIYEMCQHYEKVIFFHPNPKFLVADGLRPTNIEFQLEIHEIICEILKQLNIEAVQVKGINFNNNEIDDSLKVISSRIKKKNISSENQKSPFITQIN